MGSRARKNASGEDGFIIIEVLVSALILAIVAGAVLTLIAATTRGAAAQRAHSVGYDLAQEDQARMRTLRIPELNAINPNSPRTVPVEKTNYRVKSEAVFVNNKVGRVSCAEGSGVSSRDYIQLTSTVSGGSISSKNPVVIQSVVAPSNGSLDTEHGPLVSQTLNAAGEPVSGVTVTLTSVGKSATTETQGCANFAELANGTYNAVVNGNGLINPEGKTTQNVSGTVVANPENPARLPTTYWDRAATIEPEFVYVEPGTGTLRPAPVDSMYVVNSASGQPAPPIGTPGATRSAIQVDKAVYPFKSSEYTVYAGSCTTNNPGTSTANKVGLYSGEISPGSIVRPQIRMPAFELTVTNASGVIAPGARVTMTDTNSGCKYSGNSIKRVFTTNAGGHLSNSATGPNESALPFGTYKICASLKVGTEVQSLEPTTTVKVENFATAGTTLALKLAKAGKECA